MNLLQVSQSESENRKIINFQSETLFAKNQFCAPKDIKRVEL